LLLTKFLASRFFEGVSNQSSLLPPKASGNALPEAFQFWGIRKKVQRAFWRER